MNAAAQEMILAALLAFCSIGRCFMLILGILSVRVPTHVRLFVAVAAVGGLLVSF